MNKNLFRANAIENLSAKDNIYSLLTIIHPPDWLWILCLILLLSGVLVWGFAGTISLNIEAQGILFPAEKISEIENNIFQTIKEHNEKTVLLENLYNKKKSLYQKHYLTIDSLLKAKEDYIAAKEELSDPNKNYSSQLSQDSIVYSKNSANTALEAIIFVNHFQGKMIRKGMEVYLLPNSVSSYDNGYILGSVISVSQYPISKQLAYSYMSNMNLVDDFFVNGSPFVVKVQLKKDSATKSGLTWTTKSGPAYSIEPGTIITAKIIYKKSSPFKYATRM